VPSLDAQIDEAEEDGVLVGRDEASLRKDLQQLLQEGQHHRGVQ
jgi:hypothetical protein